MKKILINAKQGEEVRVALVDGDQLFDLDIEINSQSSKSGSIYKASISHVEPSLDAVFVNYGQERQGFLSIREIAKENFRSFPNKPFDQVSIAEVVKKNQDLLVQVTREERGNKGAALSTYISIAGRYIVLTVNNARTRGISKRIISQQAREDAYALLNALQLEDNEGVIVRTCGVGHKVKELQEDVAHLRELWKLIKSSAADKKAPALLYRERSPVVRALHNYFNESIEEVVVDDAEAFSVAKNFLQLLKPEYLDRLQLHDSTAPLFSRYKIEEQIFSAFQREVKLPSGGSVFFDQTEAMLAIDTNSAKSTKGHGGEETARHTNMEAVHEIARQLRLRDAGGLIVIDFIDMQSSDNKKAVEDELLKAMQIDKARYQIGTISRFGLLEMSRQRMRSSLGESSHVSCPRCKGSGIIRTVESMALFVLRALSKQAHEGESPVLITHTPINVASYLFNEKYKEIAWIEKQSGKRLFILPDKNMEIPDYRISPHGQKDTVSSYQMLPQPDFVKIVSENKKLEDKHEPAVVSYTQVVSRMNKSKWGWSARIACGIWRWLRRLWGGRAPKQPAAAFTPPKERRSERQRFQHTRHHRQNRRYRYSERWQNRDRDRPRPPAHQTAAPQSSKLKRHDGTPHKQGSGLYRKRRREKLYNQTDGKAAFHRRSAPLHSPDQSSSQTNKPQRSFLGRSQKRPAQEKNTGMGRKASDVVQTSGRVAKDLSSNVPFKDVRTPAAEKRSGWSDRDQPPFKPDRSLASEPVMVQVKTKSGAD